MRLPLPPPGRPAVGGGGRGTPGRGAGGITKRSGPCTATTGPGGLGPELGEPPGAAGSRGEGGQRGEGWCGAGLGAAV